jgi:hypothetical protein
MIDFCYREDGILVIRGTYWTHAQYLAGVVPKPFYGLAGEYVKPHVRVKMGRNQVTGH